MTFLCCFKTDWLWLVGLESHDHEEGEAYKHLPFHQCCEVQGENGQARKVPRRRRGVVIFVHKNYLIVNQRNL